MLQAFLQVRYFQEQGIQSSISRCFHQTLMHLNFKFCGRAEMRVKIIPLVVESLVAIPKQFCNRLKEIGDTAETGQVQKTVLFQTPTILRQVLAI